jgi:hypothetical protein
LVSAIELFDQSSNKAVGYPDRAAELLSELADPMKSGIQGSELVVFETCAQAPIYESVAEFNEKTLNFLNRSPR